MSVTRPNFQTWLKDTKGVRVDGACFVVGVPTEFIKEWLTQRMSGLAAQAVAGVLGQPMEVSFEILGRNGNGHSNGHASATMPLAAATPVTQAMVSSPSPRHRLNPRFTFQSFVIADTNRLAAAAAAAAAEEPGSDYNPLYIYGSPGLGKTHLLQAIAQRAAQKGTDALYVTSEQFTNEFVTSIANGRGDEFRRRYRSVQLLLVDDIQFLANKARTQEEFFYTFNDLQSDGGQVVVAGDRHPASMQGLEGRLSSRFQGGLIADIQPPAEETRLAILEKKARDQNVSLPVDVARMLAAKAPNNIRELEGLLNRVVAYSRLTNTRINLTVATGALTALTPAVSTPSEPEAILQAVSTYFNIPVPALTGKSRAKPIVEARHAAMYLLREDADLALKQVGLILGKRDHSTIIHGCQKISKALLTDPRLAAQLAELRALVQ
jgi:chromosomal replication initiator protein